MVCPKSCHDEQSYNDHLLELESSWDVDIAKNSMKGSGYTRDEKK